MDHSQPSLCAKFAISNWGTTLPPCMDVYIEVCHVVKPKPKRHNPPSLRWIARDFHISSYFDHDPENSSELSCCLEICSEKQQERPFSSRRDWNDGPDFLAISRGRNFPGGWPKGRWPSFKWMLVNHSNITVVHPEFVFLKQRWSSTDKLVYKP